MKIIIKNIGNKVTADSLAAIFSTYGNVVSSTILSGAKINLDSNSAHVVMPDETEAFKAIEQLNGCFIDGKTLEIEPEPSKATSPVQTCYNRIKTFLSPKEKMLFLSI